MRAKEVKCRILKNMNETDILLCMMGWPWRVKKNKEQGKKTPNKQKITGLLAKEEG